jgi:hypothetical protein
MRVKVNEDGYDDDDDSESGESRVIGVVILGSSTPVSY